MDRQGGASFRDLLRDYRLAAGLTQELLAERAGISARGIRALEQGGSKPHRDTAQRLAAALGLAGADLAQFLVAATPAPLCRRYLWVSPLPSCILHLTREATCAIRQR